MTFSTFVVNVFSFVSYLVSYFYHLHPHQPHSCFIEILETPLLFPLTSCILLPPGKEKERFMLCFAVMADGKKVPLRILFKGTPFVPPATPGKGGRDPFCEPHQVWPPRGRRVFRRAGQKLV